MALNDVRVNKGQGGLGRKLPGTDYVSGLLFYSGATLPIGFTSTDRIKTIFSVADAVTLGVTNTSLGETASTGTYLVTTKFTVGDNFKLTCATIDSANPIQATATAGTITLCNYTGVTADAVSTTTSATAIASAINALTYLTGFTATSATATVTITAPTGQGIFLNSGTPYVKTETGAIAGTLTQNVVAGIASDIDILYYHISEFFRMQPQGKLFVGIYALADIGTWAAITSMQNFAVGEIKQLGIYQKNTAFATSQLNGIQSVCSALEVLHKPIWNVQYAAEISGTADLTSMSTNLKALSDPQVSATIGQDGAAQGFKLFKATGKSISNVGEILGSIALAKVSESIAWLAKFQVGTTELDTIAFSNGQLYSALSDGAITNLDTLGFCILRKVIGLSGTFHNRPWTAVLPTSDYNEVHPNRTIFKAIANTRATLLPETGRPIFVNANGTLTEDTIGYFKGLVKQGLDSMVRNTELSNYVVIIDPAQDVLGTGELVVTVQLLPVGTANMIVVNIGFTNVLTTTA